MSFNHPVEQTFASWVQLLEFQYNIYGLFDTSPRSIEQLYKPKLLKNHAADLGGGLLIPERIQFSLSSVVEIPRSTKFRGMAFFKSTNQPLKAANGNDNTDRSSEGGSGSGSGSGSGTNTPDPSGGH